MSATPGIEHINEFRRKVKEANKELTKKEAFKDLLNRLYAANATTKSVIDAISAGAEQTILNIPRQDKAHRGQADTLYNKIIIEFENDLKKTGRHAKEQLAGYLLGQFNSGEGYNFTLIASDFLNWKLYASDVSCLDKLETLKEDELILNEIESSSFTLTEHNASAQDANATIVQRADLDLEFIVDTVTYAFDTNSDQEAYYLAAVLNSSVPNEMIKDFQARGLYGARDIHKKILDVWFPRYGGGDATHLRLTELSAAAHAQAAEYLRAHPPQDELNANRLGRLRVEIKQHLANERQEMDNLVANIMA